MGGSRGIDRCRAAGVARPRPDHRARGDRPRRDAGGGAQRQGDGGPALQGRIRISTPCSLDLGNSGVALAGILRPGNAAAYDAADHVRVLELGARAAAVQSSSAPIRPVAPEGRSTSSVTWGWSTRSVSGSPTQSGVPSARFLVRSRWNARARASARAIPGRVAARRGGSLG